MTASPSLQEEYIASVLEHAKDVEGRDHDKMLRAVEVAIKVIDALYIAEYLRQRKPKKILEVGSFLGFSARWILEITQAWQAHLTVIDPNVYSFDFTAMGMRISENSAKHIWIGCISSMAF